MSLVRRCLKVAAAAAVVLSGYVPLAAQAPAAHDHEMPMAMPPEQRGHEMAMPDDDRSWMLMQDGVVFGLVNHQAGPRGGDELRVPNWWMGMASRSVGRRSRLTLTSMFSLDPATVGRAGYREIFQAGEALDGMPLVDRQHPHDFFMQLSAIWRTELAGGTGITIAGGPVGEPALGPVAFMHRASAFEDPMAPLGHHTFDSTHIAFGVATVAVDRGPFVVEGSLFNGREPDQNRWDFDFGSMDSVAARLWYRPSPRWELQVSTGHLRDPEALEPGSLERTTASAGWTKIDGTDLHAFTAGYGVNATAHGTRQAFFAEGTRRTGGLTTYGRAEWLQPELARLLRQSAGAGSAEARGTLGAFTGGVVRDVMTWRGFEGAVGGQLTLYAVPETLREAYGTHPASVQLFFRLRPPAPMGRMLNMRMSQPPQAAQEDMPGMGHGAGMPMAPGMRHE